MSTDTPYFGIDFGTTNSSMAWFNPRTNQAEIILNAEGEPKTPSVVYFDEGEILIGRYAEDKLEEFEDSDDPQEREEANQRVVRSIKRNLITPPVIPVPDRRPVRPVEVVAYIMGKLKQDAEKGRFYEEIERVVITCPAVFGPREKEVLLEAAAKVGFRRVEVLEEPTAAALAFTRLVEKVGKGVVIYDLGAGTFDLSVVVRDEDGSFYVPMDPQGDPRCGGDDLDLALYRHCDEIAREKLGRPISLTADVDLVFLKQCRARKHNLTRARKGKFSSLLPSENGSQRFKYEVDRETFEGLIRPRIEGTAKKTARLWEQVKDRVDRVVLIGGSSQVPLVERLLAEALPVEPHNFAERDYAVALGAAYHAYDLWNEPEVDENVEEYRRSLRICWQDRKLTRMEVEWLRSLAEQELQLSPEDAARIEREVMGDTLEGILVRQEQTAREHYGWILKLGWREKKLDVLQSIPPGRLDMLLDNRDLFRHRDFADCPVSAAERGELLGEMPWPLFVMAARVVADSTMNQAASAERLRSLADELGLSKEQAADVERTILGETFKETQERQRQAVREEYREAVKEAAADSNLTKAKVEWLHALQHSLDLSSREASDIEVEVLGGTIAAVLAEQGSPRVDDRTSRGADVDDGEADTLQQLDDLFAGSGSTSQEEAPSKPTVTDLTRICAGYTAPYYWVGDAIPQDKLSNARASFPIPNGESVVALIDATFFSSNKHGIAIGENGIYWHNYTLSTNRAQLSWSEFSSVSISVVGDSEHISFGGGNQYDNTNSSFEKNTLVRMLQKIQALFAPYHRGKSGEDEIRGQLDELFGV